MMDTQGVRYHFQTRVFRKGIMKEVKSEPQIRDWIEYRQWRGQGISFQVDGAVWMKEQR